MHSLLQDAEGYVFHEKDSPENIILGDKRGPPVTAANLLKLIERITYHRPIPSDPKHKTHCNDCGVKISSGFRYKCLECKSFDQCETCASKPLHPISHIFLKLRVGCSNLHLEVFKDFTVEYEGNWSNRISIRHDGSSA